MQINVLQSNPFHVKEGTEKNHQKFGFCNMDFWNHKLIETHEISCNLKQNKQQQTKTETLFFMNL